HLGEKRAADRAAGQIGAVEPGLEQQLTDRQQPIEMAVEHGMAAVAAWEARERGHDHCALARQCVEEREPSRQAATRGAETESWPLPFPPYPAGKAIDFD